MQCMYMHKMCTVINGMNTDSNYFLEENSQILQQTVKKMTALNLQMLQCLPIHMKQVIWQMF